MDKILQEAVKARKQRKKNVDRKLIEENDKTLTYFIEMWESVVENHGVEHVYFITISKFAELASELDYPVFKFAEIIAGRIGLLCYKKARLTVLYSEKYCSESELVRNKLHDRKI